MNLGIGILKSYLKGELMSQTNLDFDNHDNQEDSIPLLLEIKNGTYITSPITKHYDNVIDIKYKLTINGLSRGIKIRKVVIDYSSFDDNVEDIINNYMSSLRYVLGNDNIYYRTINYSDKKEYEENTDFYSGFIPIKKIDEDVI